MEERFPNLGQFGVKLSILGNWCAITETELFSGESNVHLFRKKGRTSASSEPWSWSQTIHGLFGDIHLHGRTLLTCRADYGGLQEYRLVNGVWQEFGEPIAELWGAMEFEGDGRKLVAGMGNSFSSGSRNLWALNFTGRHGWKAEKVASVNVDGSFQFDREGKQVIVAVNFGGEALRRYVRGRSGWYPSGILESDSQAFPRETGSFYNDRFALRRGKVVGLRTFTDFLGAPLGSPSELSVFRLRAGKYEGIANQETRGEHWGITSVGGLIILFGGTTDFLGNPTTGELEIYGASLRPIAVENVDAQVVDASGRWLIVSDSTVDFLGNPVGGTVTIFRR